MSNCRYFYIDLEKGIWASSAEVPPGNSVLVNLSATGGHVGAVEVDQKALAAGIPVEDIIREFDLPMEPFVQRGVIQNVPRDKPSTEVHPKPKKSKKKD